MSLSLSRLLILTSILVSGWSPALAGPPTANDWNAWRHLPVLEGGRYKPLDTVAWETLRTLCNRASYADPETHQRLEAHALYLAMFFDWQGGTQPANPHGAHGMEGGNAYFRQHQPDKWDQAPLLTVGPLALRDALNLPKHQQQISPLELSRAKITPPERSTETPFLLWTEELQRQEDRGLTAFEKQALDLANRYWAYQDHRMGRRLAILPIAGNDQGEWLSAATLLRTDYTDANDPTGGLRRAKDQLQQARQAYQAGTPEEFQNASAAFLATVREFGPQLGTYPVPRTIGMEVAYNRWVPFRFAWVFSLLAFLSLLLHLGTRWRLFYAGGWLAFGAALIAMTIGFALRVAISGRAPVTNMYESVIYLGLGVTLFGMLFEGIYRTRYLLTAATAVATLTLILADNCPAALDPSLQPLQPVLRNNFWLVTHVMTITLSYAAFALALGIGNIALGYYLVGSDNERAVQALTKFIYQTLQVGVLLLAAGTILGGVWADYSWGRFWGWDPKEVWALVALLGYLAVLHARYVAWVREFGLAALAILCFALVVMAWYGVNFVLGAGLHSYGFGGGGQAYVFTAIALQFVYVAAAGVQKLRHQADADSDPPYILTSNAWSPAATRPV